VLVFQSLEILKKSWKTVASPWSKTTSQKPKTNPHQKKTTHPPKQTQRKKKHHKPQTFFGGVFKTFSKPFRHLKKHFLVGRKK
ncbi:hypothetical protein, partial [Enterococcus faecalis]|uniref:hypothetical protein n=1 Tax=Enterococcus faecalis TaxID=1351 RepID=UPI003D6A5AE8